MPKPTGSSFFLTSNPDPGYCRISIDTKVGNLSYWMNPKNSTKKETCTAVATHLQDMLNLPISKEE
ncbi:MAG: hypothetical protein Q4A82_05635 [Corynebacterium sp.]|nr:hypothetical protein [Corynebacterium sp.]